MSGWIKVYRNLIDNPKRVRSSRLALWLYILLSVNHTPGKAYLCGKEITLNPGQGVFSTPDLAKKLCEPVSVIRRSLEWFESEQQIEQRKTNQGTVITVLNWDKYQQGEQPSEQQVNNDRTTSEQQVNNLPIIKEYKELKNKEKEIKEKEKPEKTEFDLFWEEYPRKEGKGAARKSFEKAINKTTLDVLLGAVKKQKQSDQWNKDNGQYIPHPATWLNQERWDDDLGSNGVNNGTANATGKNVDRKSSDFESRVEEIKRAVRTAQEQQRTNLMGTLPFGGDFSGEDIRADKPWERKSEV